MKKKLTVIILSLSILLFGFVLGEKKVPSVNIKDLQNKVVNTSSFSNNGKPIIISFWATWCSPCKKELNNIADFYEDWQEETGVKLIAISIDDTRFLSRVKPYVLVSGWEYEVYTDANQDFKRAMNVNNVPHIFLIDGEGNIVYEHNNYVEGDENKLYEELLTLK
jgi:cytochrome c biogenesis protein CcmG/thiol:disulfide interchange protein DsbE